MKFQELKMGNKLYFLHGIRGLAALYVLIGHSRWLLWEGYSNYILNLNQYSAFDKILVYLFSMFKFGDEAVLVFFILSGFVIHLKYSRNLINNNTQFDFADFFKRRLKRIYPPLVLCIFLTFILDSTGKYLNLPIYFDNTNYTLINSHIKINHDFGTLVGNLFFLMNYYVNVFGSNSPLWSLSYEWWFYCFYVLFFFITRKNILLATSIQIFLYIYCNEVKTNIILIDNTFSMMLYWWFGKLLADVYTKRLNIEFKYLSFFSFSFLFLFLMQLNDHAYLRKLFIVISFIGVFSFLFYLNELKLTLNIFKPLRWLGNISYSLYVLHFPILVFISGILLTHNKQLPNHFGFVIFGIFISLLIAWLASLAVERQYMLNEKKKS